MFGRIAPVENGSPRQRQGRSKLISEAMARPLLCLNASTRRLFMLIKLPTLGNFPSVCAVFVENLEGIKANDIIFFRLRSQAIIIGAFYYTQHHSQRA